jgi:tetratricopeptide (TPR) repeat protein
VARAIALVGFAYWFAHGSIDWFWELAGLGAPAFAMLGLAVGRPGLPVIERERGRRPSRVAYAAGTAALFAGLISIILPWLSAKEIQAATGEWRRAPERAFDRLDRARTLNPLSDRPDLIAGAIASRLGDTGRMIESFGRALQRNPNNWYAHLELGVAYARQGRRSTALRELEAAQTLDPREPTIALVQSRVRRGLPISTAELDRIFLRRTFVSNRESRK